MKNRVLNDGVMISRGKISSFTDLIAWQEAHTLVLMVYEVTTTFPSEERFGLISQMRRASVSISSGIAEGFGRESYAEKVNFYLIAQASNTELQNQLLVARDVGYLQKDMFKKVVDQSMQVSKLIKGLVRTSKSIRDSRRS